MAPRNIVHQLSYFLQIDVSRYRTKTGEKEIVFTLRCIKRQHLTNEVFSLFKIVHGHAKSYTQDVIAKIPTGEIVEVIDGPEKADRLSWWFVSWNGETGWMADHTGSGRAILLMIP